MLFSGVREIVAAYSGVTRSGDKAVDTAVSLVNALRKTEQGMGFFGRTKGPLPSTVAVQLLKQHGKNLTPDQLFKVVEALQRIDDSRAVKRRFVIQVIVTFIVIGVAVVIVSGTLPATDEVRKTAYGFIGLVIGYWLK